MIEWSLEIIEFIKGVPRKKQRVAGYVCRFPFRTFRYGEMILGNMELYHGKLRAIDSEGKITLPDVLRDDYQKYFLEGVERWSYMKFPYLKEVGAKKVGTA
jgi:NAD-reducing hydrogenase large subunit